MIVLWLRLLWIEIQYLTILAGYRIRPYDQSGDARRWFWKPTQCQRNQQTYGYRWSRRG